MNIIFRVKINIIALISIAVCNSSCSNKNTDGQKVPEKQDSIVIRDSIKLRFTNLLSRYSDIRVDTLQVFYESGSEEKSNYFGKQLDSSSIKLILGALPEVNYTGNFYATYKFDIDTSYLGLITRVPSFYESTALVLLIYNKRFDCICNHVDLAEDFGDAGDVFRRISWIFKNSNNVTKLATLEESAHYHETDNPDDTAVDRHSSFFMWNLNCSPKSDTVNNKLIRFFRKQS